MRPSVRVCAPGMAVLARVGDSPWAERLGTTRRLCHRSGSARIHRVSRPRQGRGRRSRFAGMAITGTRAPATRRGRRTDRGEPCSPP